MPPSLVRSASDAFTKTVRGWEPRRTDGTAKFDKPIRGWEKRRVTQPQFRGNTPTIWAEGADMAAEIEVRGVAAVGGGELRSLCVPPLRAGNAALLTFPPFILKHV